MDFERNNKGAVERAKHEFSGEDIARNLARLGYYDSVAMTRVVNKVCENTSKRLGRQRLYQILNSRAPKREVVEWIAEGLGVSPNELTRTEDVPYAPAAPEPPLSDIPVHLRDPDPPAAWPRDQFDGVEPIDWADDSARDELFNISTLMKSVINSNIDYLTREWDIDDVRQFRDDMLVVSRAARRIVERLGKVIDRRESESSTGGVS
jgi:hypothetical protein